MPYEDLVRHLKSLSFGERIWFETCTIAGDKIVAPHLNLSDGRPAFLGVSALMRRFSTDRVTATALSAALEAIEASDAVVAAYANQHRLHRPLADILTELQHVAEMLAPNPTDVIDEASEYSEVDESADDQEPALSSVGYHVVDTLYDYHVFEPDWIDRQPRRFRRLIRKVQFCPTLQQLTELGQQLHTQQAPPRVLQAVWDLFHTRQAQLDATQPLSADAYRWRQRILTSRPDALGAVGRELYQAQHNSNDVGIADWEWGVIWRLYRAKRPTTRSHNAQSNASTSSADRRHQTYAWLIEHAPTLDRLNELATEMTTLPEQLKQALRPLWATQRRMFQSVSAAVCA
jgi:hypothetical protein